MSANNNTHKTHTFLSLFVDSSKTRVTSLRVVAEDDGPGRERQPIRAEE